MEKRKEKEQLRGKSQKVRKPYVPPRITIFSEDELLSEIKVAKACGSGVGCPSEP